MKILYEFITINYNKINRISKFSYYRMLKYPNTQILFLSFILCLLSSVFFLQPSALFADDLNNNTGKDFWLTYIPNYHSNFVDENDSIYIFVSALVPTTGKITYKNKSNRTFVASFSIIDPTKMFILKLHYLGFELEGFNDGDNILNPEYTQCETIAKQSFHIETEHDVIVYAHSQAHYTSDAFLVLPTTSLEKDYFILSYNSDGYEIEPGQNMSDTPSQFAIVATEDNTTVTINPSTTTFLNGTRAQNFTLNKGDVYLVQARIDRWDWNRDLSGTEVVSDKPIAVFTGHQRSTLPINVNNTFPSRDVLIEQLPPVKYWGKNAILVPYPQPSPITRKGNDIFRIIAANDNTEITINGNLLGTLSRGEFYQDDLLAAAFVQASGPIMVAQYKKTSQDQNLVDHNPYPLGDPFMMILPQIEMFGTYHHIINVQAFEFDSLDNTGNWVYSKVYQMQYLTIVAPNSTINTIKIDTVPVNSGLFNQIPNCNYSYAWVSVSDGIHIVTAEEGIGVFIYGYGPANSYGYSGGMNFKKIDTRKPVIASNEKCFISTGYASDNQINDSKIQSVSAPDSLKVNSIVQVDNFIPLKDTVKFHAELIDHYQDGKYSIIAVDSVGFTTRQDIEIPGFTLKAYTQVSDDLFISQKYTTRKGMNYCFYVLIKNYGKFSQEITYCNFSQINSNFTVSSTLPKTILPGKTDSIYVCFLGDSSGIFNDTLVIGNDCINRKVAALSIDARVDTENPKYSSIADSCNRFYRVVFTDSTSSDYGIASVKTKDSINCLVNIENFTPQTVNLNIAVIDPNHDAYFKIAAKDSMGHETEFESHIPGYTISFPELTDTTSLTINVINYGHISIGELDYYYLKLHNYGSFEIVFTDAYFMKNIYFSIPQSQFPFKIAPGAFDSLLICYKPLRAATSISDRDTLRFFFNCISKAIGLQGLGDIIVADGDTKCNVPIRVTTKKVPAEFSLDQNIPNPVTGLSTIKFNIPNSSNIKIRVFDLFGNEKMKIADGDYPEGSYKITLSSVELPQGCYIYTLESEGIILSRMFIVNK